MRSCGAAVLFGVALLVGCDGGPTAGPADQPFEGRLKAALAVSNSSTRDEALAAVATDAAQAGAGYTVRKAVGAIANSSTKDKTASACAVKLVEVGQADAANDVAGLIANSSTRDQTLARIAKTAGQKAEAPPPSEGK